ncbi:MAG TPA: hypothetical protein VN282_03020 [Pyrinomonadaceae bacterium]|nr:hypothetical protein [Pyrinomonadaceae bacterium]
MKRLFTTVLLLTLSAAAHAQQQPAPVARLIDEFGEIQFSDLMARLDNFAVELQNEPAARGVVVAYGSRHKFPGWPLRRAHASHNYLVNTRGLDASRLSTVFAGLREESTFQLWVVPPGAEPPAKHFDPVLLMSGEKTPLPFDRYSVIERGDPPESEYGDIYPDEAELYKYFVEVLKRDPALRGCVIGYTSRRGSLAAGRRIAARAKLTMAKAYAVDVTRVAALGGGRREYKMIELWLVPPGAPLPRPSPALRGKRR